MKKISLVLMLFILSLCSVCCAKDVPLSNFMTVPLYQENNNIRANLYKEKDYIITDIVKGNGNIYKAKLAGSDDIAIIFNTDDNGLIMQINYCVKKDTVINDRNTKDILMDLAVGVGCFAAGGVSITMDEIKEMSSDLTSDLFMVVYMERKVTRYIKYVNKKFIYAPVQLGDYYLISVWATDE